jgi:1,4-dihydroxy-2-naphthoyl-CoA hydrolase
MFITHNKVRMHDTDMAGILYFPRQFRFVHDALEDLMAKEGLNFDYLFTKEKFSFVVVHAEADYKSSLHVGDEIEVHMKLERMGETSFTWNYFIYRKKDRVLAGTAKTVHVAIERTKRHKIPIPPQLREIFEKYQ